MAQRAKHESLVLRAVGWLRDLVVVAVDDYVVRSRRSLSSLRR